MSQAPAYSSKLIPLRPAHRVPISAEIVLCCDLPTVCFLSGRVESSPGENKTKIPSRMRAHIHIRTHPRAHTHPGNPGCFQAEPAGQGTRARLGPEGGAPGAVVAGWGAGELCPGAQQLGEARGCLAPAATAQPPGRSRGTPGSPGSRRGYGSTSHSCSCAGGSAWLPATGSGWREKNTE